MRPDRHANEWLPTVPNAAPAWIANTESNLPVQANPTVSKTIPNYLRIHRGPQRHAEPETNSQPSPLDSFWDAYTEVTGWRVDPSETKTRSVTSAAEPPATDHSAANQPAGVPAPMSLLPAFASDSMMTADDIDEIPAVSQSCASRLATAATRLTDQLRASQEALRNQEIELAARAAVVAGSDRLANLADAVEQSLSDACLATNCQAAAIYMLDDDTRLLSTRSIFGLPHERLAEAPRELKDCRGDLEALIQGVVLIDRVDNGTVDTWRSPEDYEAAICVCLTHNELPIGTIWLFADNHREFGNADAAVARLLAGQVTALLTSNTEVVTAPSATEAKFAIEEIANWQYRLLPSANELSPGWRVDGMIDSPNDWAVGWHSWDILPDGTMILAIAEAQDHSIAGSMHASVARAALAAHTGYRHTPAQIMQRINDTLWQTNTGDQLVSLLYARLDPETGEGEVASAGDLSAMIASRYGYRPVVHGDSAPLASYIDGRCATTTFRMMPGEVLMAYGPGVSQRTTAAATDRKLTTDPPQGIGYPTGQQSIAELIQSETASQVTVGECLRNAMAKKSASPLADLRRAVADFPLLSERGATTILRQ